MTAVKPIRFGIRCTLYGRHGATCHPRDLSDFKSTLALLFAYKHHHVKLAKVIEPAYHRKRRGNILRSETKDAFLGFYTGDGLHNLSIPSNTERGLCPDTLLYNAR